MEQVKGALNAAKEAMLGQSADQPQAGAEAAEATGTAHKTAPVQETGTGVVRSVEEAGHRAMEQQGADNPGWYEAQARLGEALQRGQDQMAEKK